MSGAGLGRSGASRVTTASKTSGMAAARSVASTVSREPLDATASGRDPASAETSSTAPSMARTPRATTARISASSSWTTSSRLTGFPLSRSSSATVLSMDAP